MFSLLPSRSASQIKCGFSHTLLNEDEDVEVDEDLEQSASYHGVSVADPLPSFLQKRKVKGRQRQTRCDMGRIYSFRQ